MAGHGMNSAEKATAKIAACGNMDTVRGKMNEIAHSTKAE